MTSQRPRLTWQPAPHDAEVGMFDRWAARYRSQLQGVHHRPAHVAVARRARGLAPDTRCVLDIGGGSGKLLRRVAAAWPCAGLVGIDLSTLDAWEDFRCPACDKLEKADGRTFQQLANNSTHKIQYRLAAFLDRNLGGTGSMGALQVDGPTPADGGVTKFKAFHDVPCSTNRPSEQTDGFGNLNALLDLAKKAPGLVTTAFTKNVKDRVYARWAQTVTDAFNVRGVTGTPTLTLDGSPLAVFDGWGNAVSSTRFIALIQQTGTGK